MKTYIEFQFEEPDTADRKTEVWRVHAIRDGALLGVIKWYGPWRQYTFWPMLGTVFNPDCLDAINEKIRGLMHDRSVAYLGKRLDERTA